MSSILSKAQSARRLGTSVRQLERLNAAGEGPPIIRLGTRKVGILDSDLDAWIASRRVVPPGFKPSSGEAA